MRLFFWVCLLCMIPGLLIRIPVGGAGILLADIILPVFAGLFVIDQLVFRGKIPSCRWLLPGVVFGVLAIFSWLLNGWDLDFKEKIISFSYIVRWISLLVFGLAGARYSSMFKFLNGLWMIIFIIVLGGYLQFYLIPDISNYSTVGGFDPHIGRFLGTWMDPNFVAGLLAFFVPVMLGQFYQGLGEKDERSEKKRPQKFRFDTVQWGLGVLIWLSLYALFLTFSRSGYLAAGLGLGLFFLFRDPKIILIGIMVVALGIGASPRAQKRVGALLGTLSSVILQETDEVDPTASLRVESWTNTLELWGKYPLFGIGYNTYRYIASDEGVVDESYFSSGGSDSTLLTILVTTGVFGFLAFMWWYGAIWFQSFEGWWKRKWSSKGSRPYELYLGVWCGWSALFVHSFFVNSMLFPLILMPVMGVVGVMMSGDSSS